MSEEGSMSHYVTQAARTQTVLMMLVQEIVEFKVVDLISESTTTPWEVTFFRNSVLQACATLDEHSLELIPEDTRGTVLELAKEWEEKRRQAEEKKAGEAINALVELNEGALDG